MKKRRKYMKGIEIRRKSKKGKEGRKEKEGEKEKEKEKETHNVWRGQEISSVGIEPKRLFFWRDLCGSGKRKERERERERKGKERKSVRTKGERGGREERGYKKEREERFPI